MKYIKQAILILLAISLIAMPLTVNASATSSVDALSLSEYNNLRNRLFFKYEYDTTQGFRYDSKSIPVDFFITGLRKGQMCVLSVSSSLDVTTTLRAANSFNSANNHVDLDLSFSDNADTMRNKDTCDLSVDYITITASSESSEIIPCTLTLYILNTLHGVFVSYNSEEQVKELYYLWMFENDLIDEVEYNAFLNTKGLAVLVDEQTYYQMLNCATGTRSVQATKVAMNYTITQSGNNLIVSGAITWSDSSGAFHPLKNIQVEIVDDDVTFDDVVATTTTNSTGNFSATFTNQTGTAENGGCDIFVRAYPKSSNISVKTTSNANYSYKSPTTQNVATSVDTIYSVLNPCDTANAFQIHQAAIVGAQYVKTLSGSAPSNCNFRYPYTDSQASNYNHSYIEITSSAYYSWDIILHEYGHYIQDIFNIENNPGGDHTISYNMIDVYFDDLGYSLSKAKDYGCRLAWAEGWATYFGVAAQVHQKVYNLGIPGAGDAGYDDFVGDFRFDNESRTGRGEGNELAITCVLWDMMDSSSTTGSVSEAHDSLSLGHATVWNYTVNSGAKTFSEFIDYVYANLSTTNYRNIGDILGRQNITAKTLQTNNSTSKNYHFSSDAPPTFNWVRSNGSTHCTDSYALEIYDTSMNLIYSISISSGATSHTLSSTRWNNLKTNYGGGFYWCVKATPLSTPATGPYYSQFIRCYLTDIL
jgi:hypothetical protein